MTEGTEKTNAVEKKTLRLEAGKRYLLRTGWITPPLQFDDEFDKTYPFCCGTDEAKSWMADGRYFQSGEDPEDIVAEFVVDGSIVPGVPEGWKLVRIGHAKANESFIACSIDDFVLHASRPSDIFLPIVERIEA